MLHRNEPPRLELARLPTPVVELRNLAAQIGVPVSDNVVFFQTDLRMLERQTVAQFDLGVAESDTPIELLDGYIGDGYAIPYPAAIHTLRLVARTEGILLDPTYTAKSMTGFLDAIRTGSVRSGALPVLLHTGGVFGLMARSDLFAEPAEA